MGINIQREKLLSLRKAANWWAERTGERKSTTTLWRWAKVGVLAADGSRVRLEVLQDGHRLKTSLEAMQRLFDALDGIRRASEPRKVRPDRFARSAGLSHEEARRQLIELGA